MFRIKSLLQQLHDAGLTVENGQLNPVDESNQHAQSNSFIVVFGAGIAGSVAALSAHRRGHKVLVLTNHYPSRPQIIGIAPDRLTEIEHLTQPMNNEDIRFFNNLKENAANGSYLVSIKTFETFLHRKMRESNIPVIYIKKEQVEKIDTDECVIGLQLPEISNSTVYIKYSHLVEATGSRRAVVHKLQEKYPDTIETITFEPNHAEQGTAVFHIKTECLKEKKGFFSVEFNDSMREVLIKLGWNYKTCPYDPHVFITINRKGNKLSIGGDVPPRFSEMPEEQQRKEIETWFRSIINYQFDIPTGADTLEIPDKSNKKAHYVDKYDGDEEMANQVIKHSKKLAVTHFRMKLDKLSKSILVLPSNADNHSHVIVIIGDARCKPNFHQAYGANRAIAEAYQFGECLSDKTHDPQAGDKFNVVGFETYCQESNKWFYEHLEDAQANYNLVIANSNWDTANSNWDVILNYTRKLLNYTKKHPVKAGISLISLVFLMGMTMLFIGPIFHLVTAELATDVAIGILVVASCLGVGIVTVGIKMALRLREMDNDTFDNKEFEYRYRHSYQQITSSLSSSISKQQRESVDLALVSISTEEPEHTEENLLLNEPLIETPPVKADPLPLLPLRISIT